MTSMGGGEWERQAKATGAEINSDSDTLSRGLQQITLPTGSPTRQKAAEQMPFGENPGGNGRRHTPGRRRGKERCILKAADVDNHTLSGAATGPSSP
ncbi:hypothetical protein EYF80_019698 [Liparis tanakae]|uniref:Uncharacterized protein n=1 Tax=Liparis tanakae TaxID=230148 RepID=A0A4Z2HYK9_9TELE|nr:hypothetical protein EYF80_019698 [Liparis tanakae]